MLGLPYMGSKRAIAPKIIRHIMQQNPNCTHFYDLFGGGGAMSFAALKNKRIKNVYYNEIDTAIVALLEKIRNEGVTEEFYKWVNRDTFHEHKNGCDWYAGLVKAVWSFGNNQRDYLFGAHIEEKKRLLHEVVVNGCEDSLSYFNAELGLSLAMPLGDTINDRRLKLQKTILNIWNKGQNINLKEMGASKSTLLERLQRLQRLEQLEQLQRLQQLQRLEQLHISSQSYENVLIKSPINETVIYCDIPYKNTVEYQHKFDHDKFKEWLFNVPYKVYVSSYEFPNFPCVLEIKHRSILSATANNSVVERLFCNREEKIELKLF